jgi:hypothetical protein
VLADDWWFWALAAALTALSALGSSAYRRLAARARRVAVERGLVDPGQGRRLDPQPASFWGDLSWVNLLLGAWVVLSPWVWGYEHVHGAVATDVLTGGVVVALTLAGTVFPSLHAVNVLAGLWLVVAPWAVGYGNEGGPVGLSDVVAGCLISALAIASMASAARRVAPGPPSAIGRLRR